MEVPVSNDMSLYFTTRALRQSVLRPEPVEFSFTLFVPPGNTTSETSVIHKYVHYPSSQPPIMADLFVRERRWGRNPKFNQVLANARSDCNTVPRSVHSLSGSSSVGRWRIPCPFINHASYLSLRAHRETERDVFGVVGPSLWFIPTITTADGSPLQENTQKTAQNLPAIGLSGPARRNCRRVVWFPGRSGRRPRRCAH